METEVLKEQHYVEELVDIIRSGLPKEELIDRLSDYHDNDIADALTKLTPDERRELYPVWSALRRSSHIWMMRSHI